MEQEGHPLASQAELECIPILHLQPPNIISQENYRGVGNEAIGAYFNKLYDIKSTAYMKGLLAYTCILHMCMKAAPCWARLRVLPTSGYPGTWGAPSRL